MSNDQASFAPVPMMKLELVLLPVADVDRAKAFYANQLGFNVDHDVQPNDAMRVVQLTPPGSACSITIGTGIDALAAMQPGSIQGLHLVVGDIYAARDALVARGVDVGEVDVYPQDIKFAGFRDPDGNSWVLQEMPWRSDEFRTRGD